MELRSGEVGSTTEVRLVEIGVAIEMSVGEICFTVELGLTTIETCYASSLKIDRFLQNSAAKVDGIPTPRAYFFVT